MSIKDKIKEARKILSLTQKEIQEYTGLTQRDISFLENGKKKFIPTEYIQFLNKKGVPLDLLFNDAISVEEFSEQLSKKNAYPNAYPNAYLFEKNGNPNISNDEKNTSENTHLNTHLLDKIEDITKSHAVLRKELYQDEQNIELLALQAEMGIPLIPDYAFAGFAPGSDTQILELNCEKYVIPHFKGADGLIHVKGSSMYPKYNSGDIVAFKKLSMGTFFQWNKVYIIDTEQGLLIKRVQQADDKEHILLVSENPSYKPFPLPLADIYSLAIVVGVIRLE